MGAFEINHLSSGTKLTRFLVLLVLQKCTLNDFILTDFPTPTLTVLTQSSLFTGDSVTLRCEVDQSWDGCEFFWIKDSNPESTEAAAKTLDSVKDSDGGVYRCRARRGGHYTHYSEPVTVTVYGKYFSSLNELL